MQIHPCCMNAVGLCNNLHHLASAYCCLPEYLASQIFPEPEKQNCMALLIFVSMLWASEAIPLYATSMMVAPLVVILRVRGVGGAGGGGGGEREGGGCRGVEGGLRGMVGSWKSSEEWEWW